MKLVLMRHGRAQPDAPEGDSRRTLTTAGREDVRSVSRQLDEMGLRTGLALVSPSVRTRETFDVAVEASPGLYRGGDANAHYPDALYNASVEDVLDVLGEAEADPVLLVGHNPSVSALLLFLLPEGNVPSLSMKPAETVVLEMPSLDRGGASLVAYVRPDEEKEA